MPSLPTPRSLYWRIALASLGVLVVALLVQMGIVFARLSGPSGLRARVLASEIAMMAAQDLAETLEEDPAADVRGVLVRYVVDAGAPVYFVSLAGEVTSPDREPVPPAIAQRVASLAVTASQMEPATGVASVDVFGLPEGAVVVLPRASPTEVFRDLGVGAMAGAALAATVVAGFLAWLAFAPAHRRLHSLEAAAVRLGDGDLSARAPEGGGDEIDRVAQAFNRTADALATQIERVTAEQAVRRQLLADVSHELHTPLTTIRGYVETLRMPDVPMTDADRARALAIVDDEAVRLERLIGDLLDLAKLEASGSALRLERVPAASLWARLRDRHAPAAAQAGVVLEFEESPLVLEVDGGRLEQALSNLIANALRFTPRGGTVRVRAVDQRDVVHIDVIDRGEGIAPEDQARLFDRFYKPDASRSRGGTGLGLSIVRAIAEAHGGRAEVESTPRHGSTFRLVLPTSRG